MNTCWKCGKELPEGQTECEYGCGDRPLDSEEEITAWFNQNFLEVNLKSIKSLAQLKAILRATNNEYLFVKKGTPEHRRFAKFLKPID